MRNMQTRVLRQDPEEPATVQSLSQSLERKRKPNQDVTHREKLKTKEVGRSLKYEDRERAGSY